MNKEDLADGILVTRMGKFRINFIRFLLVIMGLFGILAGVGLLASAWESAGSTRDIILYSAFGLIILTATPIGLRQMIVASSRYYMYPDRLERESYIMKGFGKTIYFSDYQSKIFSKEVRRHRAIVTILMKGTNIEKYSPKQLRRKSEFSVALMQGDDVKLKIPFSILADVRSFYEFLPLPAYDNRLMPPEENI